MTAPPPRRGLLVLGAGMMLALVLGSVHAFSVFLEPLELRFVASRAQVSLTYSLALACLTISVLLGHLLFARLRPAFLAVLVCILAAAGSLLAAWADSLATLWVGYSLLFGAANGLGYAFALQISAQANPRHEGLAMGLVTAAYAAGAACAPLPFDILLSDSGFAGAMTGLAVVLLAIAPLTAGLLWKAGTRLQVSPRQDAGVTAPPLSLILKLWLGYGTAVAAGLMAIGHATGIARIAGLEDWQVLGAPIVIAIFNVLGSLCGGRLADRAGARRMLTAFPAASSVALFMLALLDGQIAILVGLSVIGFTYGALITVYPAAIAALFGAVAGVRIYGRVFTAWGTAGLLAPWLAGLLYEAFGDYRIALAVAGCTGLVSLITVWKLPIGRGVAPAAAGPES